MHGEGGKVEGEGGSTGGMERRKKGKEHWKEEWKKDDTGGEVTTHSKGNRGKHMHNQW